MTLPLSGITVIEFTHMVMGPTVGFTLGGFGRKGDKNRASKGR